MDEDSNIIDLAAHRIGEWWQGMVVCALCRCTYRAVIPADCDQSKLKCDGCDKRGGVFAPAFELVEAIIIYDTENAEPRLQIVEDVDHPEDTLSDSNPPEPE